MKEELTIAHNLDKLMKTDIAYVKMFNQLDSAISANGKKIVLVNHRTDPGSAYQHTTSVTSDK